MKQNENGFSTGEDDYTGLNLVSFEFIIQGSIWEKEACLIEILKK